MSRSIGMMAAAAITLLATFGSAYGETVRLKSGADRFGNGWLFLDHSGRCLVATPAHVVTADGALLNPVLIDPKGRESRLTDVAQPDPEIDLAFLMVGGETASEGCSPSRISALPLDFVLRSLTEATLRTTSGGEIATIRLRPKAFSIDDDRGRILVFAPADPGERLSEGMSGSAILAGDRPLAMLIEVVPELGIGRALRFDAIGRLLASYRPTRSPAASSPPIADAVVTLLAGSAVDPANGPDALLHPGRIFQAHPQRGRLSVIVRFARPRPVSVFRLAAANGRIATRLRRAVLSAAGTNVAGFSPVRSCDATGRAGPAFDCTIATRTVTALRVDLVIDGNDDVSLSDLRLD
jgi:hypothetical protein